MWEGVRVAGTQSWSHTYTTSSAGLSNSGNTALGLAFIKAPHPLSKGRVKMKMGSFLMLDSSRQTAMSQAATPLSCSWTSLCKDMLRASGQTCWQQVSGRPVGAFWQTPGPCSLNPWHRQRWMAGEDACLGRWWLIQTTKKTENLTWCWPTSNAIFPRDKFRSSCSAASSWSKGSKMAVHHFQRFLNSRTIKAKTLNTLATVL